MLTLRLVYPIEIRSLLLRKPLEQKRTTRSMTLLAMGSTLVAQNLMLAHGSCAR